MTEEIPLPEGWVWTTLGEATKPIQKRVNPQNFPNLPYIGMENVEPHTMRLLGTTPASQMKSTADSFDAEDVLYGRLRPYLNKVLCPDFVGLCSTEFIVFRKVPAIYSKYLQYFFNSWEFVNFSNSLHAGDRPRVKFEQLSDYPLPLPPIPAQKQIVAKIEELFTQLDAGVDALRRVQAELKRYKASVLKAACEGRLVPQDPSDEPAEELLLQLGKKPLEGKDLPSLPEGWFWVAWEAVLDSEKGAFRRGPFGSTLKKSIFVKSGYKVYEQYCPINDDCSFGRYYITTELFEKLKSFEVKTGDYLISCSGTLGRITRVPENSEKGIINQALLRVRINDRIIDHKYFHYIFRSPFFQDKLIDSSTGTAISNVKGVKELKALPIPLPPHAEQLRIVKELESQLSVVREVEIFVEATLARAARLRQAILKRAFEGKLVV